VSFLFRRERDHLWAREQFAQTNSFLTCDAVLTETLFLLRNLRGGSDAVFRLLDAGIIQSTFRLADDHLTIAELLRKYADVPMSLADACLVRMAEEHDVAIITLDSDFAIYRKHRTHTIDLVTP